MSAPYVLHVHGRSQSRSEELRDVLSVGSPFACDPPVELARSDVHSPAAFDARLFMQDLKSSRVGATLLTAAELPSTQTLMSENFEAVPDGTVCVADVQVGGKGRGGNLWTSPPGCLMFSFNTRLRDGATLPFLQYVVTLAVVEALQELAHQALPPPPPSVEQPPAGTLARALDVRIKWPNDIYADGLKIGGVLCGSTYSEGFFRVTVGVGLNVANRDPTTCVDQLLAAAAAQRGAPAPPPVRRERLLALVLSRYEALEAQFVADRGFHSLQAAYLYHWLHSAQSVTLMEEARQVTVTLQGLTQQGYLLAVDAAGERFELHPDGNSLDFFQGLVRRKLKA